MIDKNADRACGQLSSNAAKVNGRTARPCHPAIAVSCRNARHCGPACRFDAVRNGTFLLGHADQSPRTLASVMRVDTRQPLPDILKPGLSVIFCGINPGLRSASSGHHFANGSNRFWRVVHLAGFSPEQIHPEQDRTLLRYGCGLTTAVSRPTARADELSRSEFATAASGFERKIEHYAPRYIAFLGKIVLAGMSGRREIQWGPQPDAFGGARAWVLPNPSGLNRAFDLDALVAAYRAFRVAVASTP